MLVLLLAFAAVFAFAQNVPRNVERWEYSQLRADYNNWNATIQNANRLGAEGWELVLWDPQRDDWIFKRRLP